MSDNNINNVKTISQHPIMVDYDNRCKYLSQMLSEGGISVDEYFDGILFESVEAKRKMLVAMGVLKEE